jgi:diacylglycerol O-acyltransferase
VEAQFLAHQRLPGAPKTHVAALCVFEGAPAPSAAAFVEHVEDRLARLPRLRERLAFPRRPRLRPRWVEDEAFDLGNHIAVREPTGDGGWREAVGSGLATPLDLGKPPWRLTLLPGAADGEGFAVLCEHDHALADGLGTLEIVHRLFGPEPRPKRSGPGPKGGAARRPSGGGLLEDARALGETLKTLTLEPRAPTPSALTGMLSSRRQADWIEFPASEFTRLAQRLGCFPNEAYLWMLTGGLRRYLGDRSGQLPDAALQAAVLVNVRRGRDESLGNHVSGLRVVLPVHEPDPRARLETIRASIQRIRTSRLVRGGEILTSMERYLPDRLLTYTSLAALSPPNINFLASNLVERRRPGPSFGARLAGLHLFTFLPYRSAASFVCVAFADRVSINVQVDPELVDMSELLAAIRATTDEARLFPAASEGRAVAAVR